MKVSYIVHDNDDNVSNEHCLLIHLWAREEKGVEVVMVACWEKRERQMKSLKSHTIVPFVSCTPHSAGDWQTDEFDRSYGWKAVIPIPTETTQFIVPSDTYNCMVHYVVTLAIVAPWCGVLLSLLFLYKKRSLVDGAPQRSIPLLRDSKLFALSNITQPTRELENSIHVLHRTIIDYNNSNENTSRFSFDSVVRHYLSLHRRH